MSHNKADLHLINLLKTCVEKHEIKELILVNMGITSKMICILALGIAQNQSLEELNLQHNFICKIFFLEKQIAHLLS